jgi:hypothetical protein
VDSAPPLTDAGYDLALGQMTVAHEPLAAVLGHILGIQAEKGCNLGLDRLR